MTASRSFAVAATVLFALSTLEPAAADEIWLAPQASGAGARQNSAADFMELFKPDAPWAFTAAHVKVFKLYGGYVLEAPQKELNQIVADLKRRRIAIGLEVGVIDSPPPPQRPICGGWGRVEGYGTEAQARAISAKLKLAGGTLSYLAMDEPFWYGHFFDGYAGKQPGCHTDIRGTIGSIVPILDVYMSAFPGLKIGDIEPTNMVHRDAWQAALIQWADGYDVAMNRPLDFFHVDVPWDSDNEYDATRALWLKLVYLKRTKLVGATGIIYDGSPAAASDAAWVNDATSRFEQLEGNGQIKPDQVIIQSWHVHPTHSMPETAPDTLTGLAAQYIRFSLSHH